MIATNIKTSKPRRVKIAFCASLGPLILLLLPMMLSRTKETFPDESVSSKPPKSLRSVSPSCKAMFSIDKGDKRDVWDSGGQEYENLSLTLQSLISEKDLRNLSDYSTVIYPGTRLQKMNGSIPYVPCKIKDYRSEDFGLCCAMRKASGDRTWIAFVGDSSMRFKIHEFLNFLPPDLRYTYFLGEKEVTKEAFIEAVIKHHYRPSTFDIIGTAPQDADMSKDFNNASDRLNTSMQDLINIKQENENASRTHSGAGNSGMNSTLRENRTSNDAKQPVVKEKKEHLSPKPEVDYFDIDISEEQIPEGSYLFRLSLVWAPDGSQRGHPFSRKGKKVTKLQEWLTEEAIPDVVVLGYGKWPLLLREYEDELSPFTEIDFFTRPLINVLKELATRTTVLLWSQSRYRRFDFESNKYATHSQDLAELKEIWKDFLKTNVFSDGIPLIDAWMWRILRDAGVWQWDSTLPLNLANLRECKLLNDFNVDRDPIYHGRWWSCADIHHSAYETTNTEIQMILNFLCNSHGNSDKEYCCSDS